MSRETYKQIITSPEKWEEVNIKNRKLMDSFLEEKDTRCSSETVGGYRSDLSIFFTYVLDNLENKFFVDIRKVEFLQFFSFCVNRLGWKGSARFNRMRSCLSSLSNYVERVMDDEYPTYRNIVLKAVQTMPKAIAREKTVLSEDQVNMLLKWLVVEKRFQEACLISLAVASGARISELLRIHTDIIDPKNLAYSDIFIETSKMIKTKGRTKTGDMKFKYIIKDLFMPYYDLWMPEREKIMKKNNKEHNCIFITQDGEPATLSTIRYWIPMWEEYLNVNIYMHSMRHYTVTFLTKIGLPTDLIIEIMGWKSGEAMYKIYNDLDGRSREWKELTKLKEHLDKM
jgi:site-specific recombinase XerD